MQADACQGEEISAGQILPTRCPSLKHKFSVVTRYYKMFINIIGLIFV